MREYNIGPESLLDGKEPVLFPVATIRRAVKCRRCDGVKWIQDPRWTDLFGDMDRDEIKDSEKVERWWREHYGIDNPAAIPPEEIICPACDGIGRYYETVDIALSRLTAVIRRDGDPFERAFSNYQRAMRFAICVWGYSAVDPVKEPGAEVNIPDVSAEDVVDLLTDFRHWCQYAKGVILPNTSFMQLLNLAQEHFKEETLIQAEADDENVATAMALEESEVA